MCCATFIAVLGHGATRLQSGYTCSIMRPKIIMTDAGLDELPKCMWLRAYKKTCSPYRGILGFLEGMECFKDGCVDSFLGEKMGCLPTGTIIHTCSLQLPSSGISSFGLSSQQFWQEQIRRSSRYHCYIRSPNKSLLSAVVCDALCEAMESLVSKRGPFSALTKLMERTDRHVSMIIIRDGGTSRVCWLLGMKA